MELYLANKKNILVRNRRTDSFFEILYDFINDFHARGLWTISRYRFID